jgi:hypothetical protein
MPSKIWVVGEEVLAADFNAYLQEQVVATFSTAAARTSAIPSPKVGQTTWRADAKRIEVWTGSLWETPGPIGELGYGVNANSIGGIQQTPVSIVTVVATVGPGTRRIRIAGSSMIFKGAGDTGAASVIGIFIDGVDHGARNTTVDSNEQATLAHEIRRNITAGSHTFELRLYTALSFINTGGGTNIMIDDMGPATPWSELRDGEPPEAIQTPTEPGEIAEPKEEQQ